jgi:transcriptional regulator with XRE-family HTH domain
MEGTMAPSLIGLNITKYRTALGLSKAELARRSGITATGLRYIESGRRRDVGALILCRIARALGVTLDELACPDETLDAA